MSHPAIQPMKPGEKPTEPGWYVVQPWGNPVDIIKVSDVGDFMLTVHRVGMVHVDNCAWIARIYPDRITAGE